MEDGAVFARLLSRFDCRVAAVFSPHTPYCVMRVGVASRLSHSRMVAAPKSKPEIAMHGGGEERSDARIALFVRSFAKTRPSLESKGLGQLS